MNFNNFIDTNIFKVNLLILSPSLNITYFYGLLYIELLSVKLLINLLSVSE